MVHRYELPVFTVHRYPTIGDDIESITDEWNQSNMRAYENSDLLGMADDIDNEVIIDNISSYQKMCLSRFEIDDKFHEIKSIRKFDTMDTVYNKFKKPWHLHVFLLILYCLSLKFLGADSAPFNATTGLFYSFIILWAIEDFLLGHNLLFFILLRLYFSFCILIKCDTISIKQIFVFILEFVSLSGFIILCIYLYYDITMFFKFYFYSIKEEISEISSEISEISEISSKISFDSSVISFDLRIIFWAVIVFTILRIMIAGIYKFVLTSIILFLKIIMQLFNWLKNNITNVLQLFTLFNFRPNFKPVGLLPQPFCRNFYLGYQICYCGRLIFKLFRKIFKLLSQILKFFSKTFTRFRQFLKGVKPKSEFEYYP